ncbi:MAG: glycosyltransferase, partial [Clostridiales bacterium]|nr:glycosyltransferase [Clostridiales bacterium]
MNNSNNSTLLSSPKISVIIPVYNSSEFLSECLNSLLTQTLDNIEIICVDDGSTDNSPEILKKYSEKDHRIKILKQKNQFAGTARNNGLAMASGEYLLFMDSDDFCDSRLLEKTYNKAKSEDSDIVLFNAKKYNNRLKKVENASHYFKRNLCPAKTPFSLKDTENLLSITTTSPWSKLFKNEFIKREKIKFQSLHNANDVFFVVVSLCTARRISFVDEALIFYRTNLNNNIQSLKSKYPTCFLDAYLETYKELNRRNVYKFAEKSFVNLVISGCKYNIETIKDPNARLKIFEIITGDEFSETGILSHEESYYNNNEALNTVKGSFNALNWFNKIQNKRSTPEPVVLKKSKFKAETPFVSVIVPVYNVEKYLKECLD